MSFPARLAEMEAISPPEWSSIVKTGTHRERPPSQDNWWFIRSAAILRKVGKLGPIGANHMAQHFGGPKDRGIKPNRAVAGSRNISRTIMQQLFNAGLIESKMNRLENVNHGKVLTPAGQSLLDSVAHEVRDQAVERHPGLSNYY